MPSATSCAGGKARVADRFDDQVERGAVVLEVGGEAALVADARAQAVLLEHGLQRMVGLRPPAQRLGERGRADREDHELLDVHAVIGVRAAVEDVHHRHREQVRVRPAQVAEQRQARRLGRGPRHGHAHADDGVSAQPRLVRRPVQVDHRLVDEPLVIGVVAEQLRLDFVDHALHGPLHALAAVLVAAVPELHRLERAGGRPARHSRASRGAVIERDLDLDGRVTTRIQDLPGMDRFDGSHSGDSCWMWSAWPAGRFQYWSLVQGQWADERPRRVRRDRPAVNGEHWACYAAPDVSR